MSWEDLKLWAEGEEERIHQCIIESLMELRKSQTVVVSDNEIKVSGKLRKIIRRVRTKLKLAWTFHSEASCFENEDDPIPVGHPDMRFSGMTPDGEQYDYDVECKLVRPKRQGKNWDYCEHYVTDGIQRFQDGRYAQSPPPLGTMIGYLQEGDELVLLQNINIVAQRHGMHLLNAVINFRQSDVTCLIQVLQRSAHSFNLTHLWIDLR